MKQSKTLLMEWCLDCHRHPEHNLRPKSEIFNLGWKPSDVKFEEGGHGAANQYSTIDVDGEKIPTGSQAELGRHLVEKYHVREAKTITNCSICHR